MNASVLKTPPEALGHLRWYFDTADVELRRSFYILGNYVCAAGLRWLNPKQPIIVDRFWPSSAAYALACDLQTSASEHPEIAEMPKDLVDLLPFGSRPIVFLVLDLPEEVPSCMSMSRGLEHGFKIMKRFSLLIFSSDSVVQVRASRVRTRSGVITSEEAIPANFSCTVCFPDSFCCFSQCPCRRHGLLSAVVLCSDSCIIPHRCSGMAGGIDVLTRPDRSIAARALPPHKQQQYLCVSPRACILKSTSLPMLSESRNTYLECICIYIYFFCAML